LYNELLSHYFLQRGSLRALISIVESMFMLRENFTKGTISELCLALVPRGKQAKSPEPEGGGEGGSMAPKSQKCNMLTWRVGIEFNVL
jgi:hypothetical protein